MFRGQAASAWVVGRLAPPWVEGVRRPMPSVANGFVFRCCRAGVGQRRLGGGPDTVRGGLSISVACSSSGYNFFLVAVKVWFSNTSSVL